MSIYYYFSAIFLATAIFTYVNPASSVREFVVRKDFFSNLKAGEFSVYDGKDKNLLYRIESEYSVLHQVKVIDQSNKQKVADLKAQVNLIEYKADISVLSKQGQWVAGTIKQNFQIAGSAFDINWNGEKISMVTEPVSLTTKFHDQNNRALAQFQLRPASVFITKKYDVQIYTDEYPDQIFFLALAARNHATKKRSRF